MNRDDGIWIVGDATTGNVVTQNGIGQNTKKGILLEDGANGGILALLISGQDPAFMWGTACANCMIELFMSGLADGKGWDYLDTTADGSGSFSFSIHYLLYPYLTATATDVVDCTSEFSPVFTSVNRYVVLPLVMS